MEVSLLVHGMPARKDSSFTKVAEDARMIHKTIPPSAYTYQADVESAHNLVEVEFYEIENFSSVEEFFGKMYSYLLWFNVLRKNSYKEKSLHKADSISICRFQHKLHQKR